MQQPAGQLDQIGFRGAGQVGDVTGRLGESQDGEGPAGLAGSDRLDAHPRHHGQRPRVSPSTCSANSWNCVARSTVAGTGPDSTSSSYAHLPA